MIRSSDHLLYAPEIEEAILGAALIDPVSADCVVEDLSEEDFSDPRQQAIYRAICAAAKDGANPNVMSVLSRLDESGEADMVGGMAYVAGLDAMLPNLAAVPDMIRTLRDRAMRRAILEAARTTATAVRSEGEPADTLLQKHRKALDEAEQRLVRSGEVRETCDVAAEVLHEVTRTGDDQAGILSGISKLDMLTHGLLPGRLYILAGRPGCGKSALAGHYLMSAGKAGRSAVMMSLEMGADELLKRMMSNLSGVDHSHIQRGRLLAGELDRLEHCAAEMDGWRTWLSDEAIETPQRVLAYARRHKREHGLDLLIVDYLQLMASEQKFENRNLEVAAATRAMKLGARELGCPILLLSQLNRAVERRAGGRLTLADLRDSGAVEQDADVVMFMWQPEEANDQDAHESWRQTRGKVIEIDVAKNRHGPMGSARVNFMGWLLRFQEVAA